MGEWSGIGYIITNPETGAGAYMISGGLNEGALTVVLTIAVLCACFASVMATAMLIAAVKAKYLTDEQLANKLNKTSFFNKNWSLEEVIKYTQEAYNILRNQGKTGLQSIEINGEIINVFMKEDGTFDTTYGIYKFTVEDFR